MIINSFFTLGGQPQTGLTPTIRIWQIDQDTQTLVIGDPDPVMDEVGDGFYMFVFNDSNGFDPSKEYVFRTDGGTSLPPNERFNFGSTKEFDVTEYSTQQVTDAVWDEPAADHTVGGTMGEYANLDHADIQQLRIDQNTALSLINTLLKYEENRTLVDKSNFTLTIFDNDGTTPLHIFDLKDAAGNPSITEVCERIPR